MDFNTTGHKQRKGGRPGRSGVAGLRGGGGMGGCGEGVGGVVLRGVLVRRTESIGIH